MLRLSLLINLFKLAEFSDMVKDDEYYGLLWSSLKGLGLKCSECFTTVISVFKHNEVC